MMLQLIYVSKAREGLGAGDFESVLREGRAYNREHGLTSLLVYDGFRFLQAIEGPEIQVERCFSRIANDPRHSAVDVIFLRTVATPSFGAWDLQFHRIDDGQNMSALMMIDTLTKKLADEDVRNTVHKFCGIRRRAA